ncbi:MAG: thioesterase family protein [Acidimicrobiales bacterium]
MPDALFVPLDGKRLLPTEWARGPWSPDALHGGPPAALLAGAAERAGNEAAAGPMHPARVTIELWRAVPVAPLTVSAEVVRPGRKVQLIQAELSGEDGTRLATATVLRIRTADVPVADQPPIPQPPPPSEGEPAHASPAGTGHPGFHNLGVEHRFVAGQFDELGPATDWIRLRVPVVAGEIPTPLERVVAAADFGNGVSATSPFEELSFINPDLTVYLHRLPDGEWVCLEAATRLTGHGLAIAESVLYDEHGSLGRALQSLVLEAR